ncbi:MULTISPECIES: ATP-binding protein [Actinocatenispora]|uniref:Anti-sigma regulatory factor n=2 Tax=Actinocatenispora TaxID=390988 RepID=A0A8J4EQB3_9ACTN|nr:MULTISPECIES: anti-sigma regulatory factor [Actinocatenispora]BCJ33163.1 anti-sigma regulatory factor [Actinocatenispora thailandica]GIL29634.1 anti-sigma regulatory factor [Actinocatenispora comari]
MTQALPEPDVDDEDLVVLTVPADGAYLSVLRTATAGLAARLHFTLDEIEDLRIAVDEACAMLLAAAPAEAELTCRFEVAEQTLTAAVSVPSNGQRLPGTETFAWMVLAALAGSVRSDVSGGRATIWLTKKRDGSR